MSRGSVSSEKDGRGSTDVILKITCEEDNTCFLVDAYVAYIAIMLVSEIKRARGSGSERRGDKWRREESQRPR